MSTDNPQTVEEITSKLDEIYMGHLSVMADYRALKAINNHT